MEKEWDMQEPIISSGEGTADRKNKTMKEAGIYMSDTPTNIANTLIEGIKGQSSCGEVSIMKINFKNSC